MTRWNTARPYCPAVPSTPTPCSPTLWLSAATAVPAGLTAMSAYTGPAWTEQGVPDQSDVSTHTRVRATTSSLSDCSYLSQLVSVFCSNYQAETA